MSDILLIILACIILAAMGYLILSVFGDGRP